MVQSLIAVVYVEVLVINLCFTNCSQEMALLVLTVWAFMLVLHFMTSVVSVAGKMVCLPLFCCCLI